MVESKDMLLVAHVLRSTMDLDAGDNTVLVDDC